MADFSSSLAKTIIERVGEKKEAWMVFDMDETLAHWKKTKTGDIFSLRPTVIPFLEEILNAGVKIHFAIYSNTHSKTRVDTIASTIEGALNEDKDKVREFHPCFKFYNHFKGNPAESGLRRLNVNKNVSKIGNAKRELYDTNKTVESIQHGYAESGAPLEEINVHTHLFFFDDVIYPSIRDKIGINYIHMFPYKVEEDSVKSSTSGPLSKGTKRVRKNENERNGKKPTRSPSKRKSRRNRMTSRENEVH